MRTLTLSLVLFSTAALADEPRQGTPLIADKLYPMEHRFELTAIGDWSFNDKYVEHAGGSGALAFHIFDTLAVEGFGGYLVGGETDIAKNVRNQGRGDGLPDLWQTTWFAGGDVQWAPVYGKISAVSELDLTFQVYALVGAGAEGITRRLPDLSYDEPQLRISANYGAGVRVLPWEHVALRVELRSYTGANPSDGALDISNNTMLQVGVSLVL